MNIKKPATVLEVRFEAKSLRPELISIGTLSRVLAAVYQLASGRDEEEEEEVGGEVGPFQLLTVRRGSVAYQFAGESAEQPLARLRIFGNIIENPDTIGDNDFVLGPLDTLSAIARRIDCAVILKVPGKTGGVIATIEPNTYKTITKSLFISGPSSVDGMVQGVTGATEMRCRLRVPFQNKLLYCSVENPETARKIGASMFKRIVANGTVTWMRDSWRIVRMHISDIRQPEGGKLSEARQAIRDAGGKEWDKIGDVDAFLEKVTGKR
jgi:hypothetical protein